MLQAIINKKAGTNFRQTEVNWSQLFSSSEDSLTSSILGTMMYLPIELFWNIMNEAASEPITLSKPDINSIEFWPHWRAKNIDNVRFIEPDVFIETNYLDLIIEAKRHDHGGQREQQWKDQLTAYTEVFVDEETKLTKDVVYLALGGNANLKTEVLEVRNREVKIVKCSWENLLWQISKVKDNIESSASILHSSKMIMNILNDIEAYFQLHGFVIDRWSDLTKYRHLAGVKLYTFKELSFGHITRTRPKPLAETWQTTAGSDTVKLHDSKTLKF